YWEAKNAFQSHGIRFGDVALDLTTMLKRKDQIVATLTKGVEALFKKNKITRYLGNGRIEGPGHVLVLSDGKTLDLKCKSILIATGSKPAGLPGVEFDGDRIATSTEALSYSE